MNLFKWVLYEGGNTIFNKYLKLTNACLTFFKQGRRKNLCRVGELVSENTIQKYMTELKSRLGETPTLLTHADSSTNTIPFNPIRITSLFLQLNARTIHRSNMEQLLFLKASHEEQSMSPTPAIRG